MMREKTCCFTGHRKIEKAELPELEKRLARTMDMLVRQGVIYFGCGGALGFDLMAGYMVLRCKRKYDFVKLIMVLPCGNQDARWSAVDKTAYQKLLAAADKTVCLSENYFDGCMRKRNLHLAQNSGYCIAYLKDERSGTGQTVRMAREHGSTIFNLAAPARF